MATFLDITGLKHFSAIFVFLFVWLVMYATFQITKALGENKLISALIGLLLATFTVVSPVATSIVATVAPFIAVIFVLVILMNTAIKMLAGPAGGSNELQTPLGGVFLILVVLVILITAAVKIRDNINLDGPSDLSTTSGILFNPKFLGTVLVLGIAVFTIALLTAHS